MVEEEEEEEEGVGVAGGRVKEKNEAREEQGNSCSP